MKKMLTSLGLITFVATPLITPLQTVINSEIMINQQNHKLVELAKQKGTPLVFNEYNKELYIGMFYGYLAKINANDEITQIPLKNEGNSIIETMVEFNGDLYFTSNRLFSEFLKMSSDGKITPILTDIEPVPGVSFTCLTVFNNELYFVYTSVLESSTTLIKITNEGKLKPIKSFEEGTFVNSLKSFNNSLYFTTQNETTNATFNKLDANGQITTFHKESFVVPKLTEWNNELYFSSDTGSLFKIDINDKVTQVMERHEKSYSILTVLNNELYLGTDKALEKVTKDNKLIHIINVKEDIKSLATFNNQIYIGMNEGYFAKLII